MSDTWNDVDRYISELLVPFDAALDAALLKSAEAGLPAINVAPNQGKMLELLARAVRAKTILEIGTLGGYSTIWLARALPADGRLISLELDLNYAEIARSNIERAAIEATVEVRVGKAVDSLRELVDANAGPFDLVFLDADKASYPEYFTLSLALSRPGTVIIADNVVRDGAVLDAKTKDENLKGIRRFMEIVSREPRVDATAIQTVGSKGYDGFALLYVR